MSNLLLECTEEVNLIESLIAITPQLALIAVFAPLVYIVVLGKRDKPAKRLKRFIAAWSRRTPQA
ncbi:hypothetical protein HQQ80_01980 [Microbacteriaceae bacterium VKM Ac-2855]|nr:hypothetical protein [Microbacteriaceae bacterium VKM Ac-2855]